LFGCETWALTFKEEYKLQLLGKVIELRKMK